MSIAFCKRPASYLAASARHGLFYCLSASVRPQIRTHASCASTNVSFQTIPSRLRLSYSSPRPQYDNYKSCSLLPTSQYHSHRLPAGMVMVGLHLGTDPILARHVAMSQTRIKRPQAPPQGYEIRFFAPETVRYSSYSIPEATARDDDPPPREQSSAPALFPPAPFKHRHHARRQLVRIP